ncbi:KRAB [Mytilus coruscus]|uniref:KRAB n=1 Tax=Mytilus coruscus TaxID=42192 RepID=A0A6J8AJV6_MYTCO|nr:KRAB [Mytilus coruscus]
MKATSLTRIADEEENRREAEKIFECDNCDFTTRKLNLLSSHIMETHSEVKHCCSACGYFYRSQQDVESHMVECNGKSKKYQGKCTVCNKMFYETSSMRIHQFKVHGIHHPNVKEYRCDFDGCNNTSYTLGNFNYHKKMHTREKKFSCQECQYACALYCRLLRHMRSVQRQLKPHLCEGCGKSFSSKVHLMQHIARLYSRDS